MARKLEVTRSIELRIEPYKNYWTLREQKVTLYPLNLQLSRLKQHITNKNHKQLNYKTMNNTTINNENNMPKMAELTPEQDLNLGNDIMTTFLDGESHPVSDAVALLQYIFKRNKILDEDGNVFVASLDLFPSFGIIGMKSDFYSKTNKLIPIFVVFRTFLIMKSPDWLKDQK